MEHSATAAVGEICCLHADALLQSGGKQLWQGVAEKAHPQSFCLVISHVDSQRLITKIQPHSVATKAKVLFPRVPL